jgi:hypothetical protein
MFMYFFLKSLNPYVQGTGCQGGTSCTTIDRVTNFLFLNLIQVVVGHGLFSICLVCSWCERIAYDAKRYLEVDTLNECHLQRSHI